MSRSEIVNKSTTKDSPSFKVGSEVRIIRDTNSSGLSFGEIVRITGQRCYNEYAGKYYYPTNEGRNVREDDIEVVEPKLDKQEEKVDTQSVTVVKGRPEKVISNYVYDPQTNILFNL